MKDRNKYLEMDGLYFESDTHEWFHDKITTRFARQKTVLLGGTGQDDDLNVACFVVRNKQTGEYNRVMLDVETNQPIYDTKSLEDLSFYIDKLKIAKRFKDK